MRSYTRIFLYTFTISLLLTLSAVWTVPAYADGETPPVDPPVATQPVEPPAQDQVTVDATPAPTQDVVTDPTQDKPAPVTTDVPADAVASALAEVPQGTDVVVVNNQGESLPLASQEAATAIVSGDPIWCPAGVATPSPGVSGCTTPGPANINYDPTSLGSLVTYLSTHQAAGDGVIWIASNYDKTKDNSAIVLNGSSAFTTMKNFKLTLKGGWCDGTDVTCIGLIDPTKPSAFDVSLRIINWNNDVTLSNITISGAAADGLDVNTTGNINITNVNSNTNSNEGADIYNASGLGNVTITNSHFNGNSSTGLYVQSKGIITLKDITANNNTGIGAKLDNTYAVISKAITVSGTNTFNNNSSDGLQVYSHDAITLNNITANGNANATGAYINNSTASTPKAVTLTGDNTFNQNKFNGLNINSLGQITLNNIVANGTTSGDGASIQNNNTGANGGVTLTGSNQFDMNNGNGIQIYSYGAITANSLVATANLSYGADLENRYAATAQPITLTGTNLFKFNGSYGLYLSSLGQITANNVSANNNGTIGASISNDYTGATAGVTFTGTNQFNNNGASDGAYVSSYGPIAFSNVTANSNGANGLELDNSSAISPKSITVSGVNTFNNNHDSGLYITASGAVSLSNITANNNTHDYGAYISNQWNINVPTPVTITGTNFFNHNFNHGLYVQSNGAITTNNLTANLNGVTQGNGAYLYNNTNTVTPFNITLNGINTFNGNHGSGLLVYSDGAILVNSITANSNVTNHGADLENAGNGSMGAGITLTGTNSFNANHSDNLYVYSKGAISVTSITSTNSQAGAGVSLSNTSAVSPKPITLSGTNLLNNNYGSGLDIGAAGTITINNVTANLNGQSGIYGYGAYLDNTSLPNSPSSVILSGSNTFNGNYYDGLYVSSAGNIQANNLTANNNMNDGAYLYNGNYAGYHGVTLTGTNSFTGNDSDNLYVATAGPINISNLTASSSISSNGAYLYNNYDIAKPQAVTFSGTNSFLTNYSDGLYINSFGAITINNLNASGNGTGTGADGAYLDNYAYSGVLPNPVTLTGTNTFNSNSSSGLYIRSLGAITVNNLTANNNTTYGAALYTNIVGATGNITLSGTNTLTGNLNDQLYVRASGAILINNVTANGSTSGLGADLDNTYNSSAKPVTLTGTNIFNNNLGGQGLYVNSYGLITTSNLTANNNSDRGVWLDNSSAAIPVGVTVNGINSFAGNGFEGLRVYSEGTITTNSITSNGSLNDNGVSLYNSGGSGNVIVSGTNTFSGNHLGGLVIQSYGAITLNNLTAANNVTGVGVSADNSNASTPKPVTVNGTNVFTGNATTGLFVVSNGLITTNNLTANANGISSGYGVRLSNYLASTAVNVVMNGSNTFNGNYDSGLFINSKGNITLNNLIANNSAHGDGVTLDNSFGAATRTITLTGVNTFNGNHNDGLSISSNGAVNLAKVTADANGTTTTFDGVSILTSGNITLTCGSFTNNGRYGVNINLSSPFVATLQGVVTAGNITSGTHLTGGGTLVQTIGCPLP